MICFDSYPKTTQSRAISQYHKGGIKQFDGSREAGDFNISCVENSAERTENSAERTEKAAESTEYCVERTEDSAQRTENCVERTENSV